jgi:prolyl-tRNA editing enzyme YbaK/EbsC (Cys-tRNA(Pro) deacylase)
MPRKDESTISKTKQLMKDLKVKGEIINHPRRSGRTTEQARLALGVHDRFILKVLLFKSREEYVAAIITGDRRVNTERLKRVSGLRDLKLARLEDVESLTGYSAGGIPPFVFKNLCTVFVDEEVMKRRFVVGSAGSEYAGVRFPPQELLKLGYSIARIV